MQDPNNKIIMLMLHVVHSWVIVTIVCLRKHHVHILRVILVLHKDDKFPI
jgi:hypothetical protein